MRILELCFEGFPVIADISVFVKSEPNNRRLFKSELNRFSIQYPSTTWFDIDYPQETMAWQTPTGERPDHVHVTIKKLTQQLPLFLFLFGQASAVSNHLPPLFSPMTSSHGKNPKSIRITHPCFTGHLNLAACDQFQLSGILALLQATETF